MKAREALETHTPTRIEKLNSTEMRLDWPSHSGHLSFALAFAELRYECPCASCVDEHSGKRVIQKTSIKPDIAPKGVEVIGRYALKIDWNDGHSTGMYHFDRLWELCESSGRALT